MLSIFVQLQYCLPKTKKTHTFAISFHDIRLKQPQLSWPLSSAKTWQEFAIKAKTTNKHHHQVTPFVFFK